MHPLGPTEAFDTAALMTRRIAKGRMFGRITGVVHPDPLGFGFHPTRFSDPQVRDPGKRFGVVYLGASLDVCFLEAVLRDERNGKVGDVPLDMTEFTRRRFATIASAQTLRLIDLTGDHKVRMGVPTDVTHASDQTLGRLWSEAVYLHPARVDGILYEFRLCNKLNLAVFDRAVSKLRCVEDMPLLQAPELPGVLNRYKVAIAP
jgi:hypothetical protein